ncbi:MAG: thioredoxin family protein [candidate division KSB1 bacterium]|nr:thioredoxin family protein [candidate division KSB1 bacterium]
MGREQSKQRERGVLAVTLVAVFMAAGCSPKKHELKGGIPWLYNLDEGFAQAKVEGKPLMVDFMATWCPPCKAMEDSTFSHPEVIRKAAQFVAVRIDVDKQGEVANKYNANARKYNGVGIPNVLFMTAEGEKLLHPIGYRSPVAFLAVMDSALAMCRR